MSEKYNISKDFALIDESYNIDSATITIDEMVKAFNETSAIGKKMWEKNVSDDLINVTREKIVSFDGRKVQVWIIEPKDLDLKKPSPCLIYYHGGGFIMGPTYMHMKLTREYALKAGCKVISVDYRLAPENPFPIGLKDCYSALLWVNNNAETLNIDINKIAVGGDSAGGNLAAAVCLMARDKKGPNIVFQMLCYPVTDLRMNTTSMKKYVDTPNWDADYNRKMWSIYLSKGNKGMIQYASIIEAGSFKNLPDAYVEVAEFDPLVDEGIEYANALKKGGSKLVLNETKGTVHAYDMILRSKITQENLNKRIEILKKVFNKW